MPPFWEEEIHTSMFGFQPFVFWGCAYGWLLLEKMDNSSPKLCITSEAVAHLLFKVGIHSRNNKYVQAIHTGLFIWGTLNEVLGKNGMYKRMQYTIIAVFGSMNLVQRIIQWYLASWFNHETTIWTSWGLGHLTVLSRCDEIERSWKILTMCFCFHLFFHVSWMIYSSSIILNWFAVACSITFLMLQWCVALFMCVFPCEWCVSACVQILRESSTGYRK